MLYTSSITLHDDNVSFVRYSNVMKCYSTATTLEFVNTKYGNSEFINFVGNNKQGGAVIHTNNANACFHKCIFLSNTGALFEVYSGFLQLNDCVMDNFIYQSNVPLTINVIVGLTQTYSIEHFSIVYCEAAISVIEPSKISPSIHEHYIHFFVLLGTIN